ncbi:hypothetical protein FRC01_005752 [Tulasnella sp. 417]|nr:hypothetical protein FRC01_005752 [Tulasnella sp. 417]
MVSSRGHQGRNTSNIAARKASTPVKPVAKASKVDTQTSRKRVKVASSDVKAAGQPVVGDGPTMPGLRERLLSLPVELFAEICSFLDALELRQLSLTDETFWSILVSARSDPIWRQAFKRVVPPMPECPETMPCPDYAEFLLVESCMSGVKMVDWQIASTDWKVTQRAKLKRERGAAILSKLIDLGYHEADFPRWDAEVNKSEALTDEEWERIRPTVVDAAESRRNSRISLEVWRRRDERSRAIAPLWNQVVAVASGTRAVYSAEKAACSDWNGFVTFGPIAALMAADTDGIPAQALDPIRPGALQFVIQLRRRHLVRLRNILNGLPVDHIDEEEWSLLTDSETIARLDTIAAHITKAVNGFWDSNRRQVDWYPSYYLASPQMDMAVLTPVESLSPGLMAKMLEVIGKDTNTESAVVTSTCSGRNMVLYRCARCDERVAPYLTFKGMVSHFLEKKVWFDKALAAKEKVLTEVSGSKDPIWHSTFFNDHDWNLQRDMVALDNSRKTARVRELQNQLAAAYGNDPRDRVGGVFTTTRSKKSTNQAPQRETRRICRLCPEGFSPKPMFLATLKIHIQHIHCKEANVEEDTAVFDPSRDIAPADPCVFELPFIRL